MTSKFITNADGESSLGARVNSLIKNSNKLDFLVGYFFFTGFLSIYKNIKLDTPLRILVGMNIEVDTHNYIREFYLNKNKRDTDSKNTIREEYFRNMKESINKADIFDSKEFEDSYKLFKAKLENGTLEVKKTEEPNHAKMYLFYIPKENGASGVDESKVIIGSSNLSYQGFEARNEINVYLQDSNDFEDGKKIFEELWKSAIPLVDSSNKNGFYSQVLEHTWLEKIPNPYLIYIRVLDEYFKTTQEHIRTPKELTRNTTNQIFDVSYQVDAIREGVAKVKKHSGCIIADVVGLGKSIIAASIAANLDMRTIIVSPPGLKPQWEEYIMDFGIKGGRVITEGDLELTAKSNTGNKDLLIIIDEAHNYRNEDTAKYGFLHQLCAGNKVILLSATPFNNEPDDIFSLIKLFQIPASSTIQTVNDLGNQMAELVRKYKDLKKAHRKKKFKDSEFNQKASVLAEQIRDILDPVVIRRTRVDLEKINKYKKDLEDQHIEFSKVKPPVEQTYELGDLSDIYIDTLDMLKAKEKDKGFIGARYKPLTYLKDKETEKKYQKKFDKFEHNFQQGQKNMADFMKQLLVRRFESSKYSFIKTLENVLKSMELLQEWATKYKKIPIYKKGSIPTSDMLEEYTEEVENLLFELDDILQTMFSKEFEKGLMFVETSDLKDKFFEDLDADINLFKEFLKKWKKIKADPKLDTIVKKLKKSLEKENNRKIIVFTEFKDTADYLYEELKKHDLKVMEYSSAQASKANRIILRKNFDAGYPVNMQEDKFKILVATDTLSEGFSLHRAGTIYNYDIPYNPTRVIQRVGRINRINKKVFNELNIYNYFPTATGEEISHTHEISTFKMKLFQAILGSDTQILTKDETLNGYLSKKFAEVKNEVEKESWDVKYINDLYRIKKEEPKLFAEAKKLPYRCRIARQKDISDIIKDEKIQDLFSVELNKGVLLFSKKGDSYRFCFAKGTNDVLMLSPQQAISLFESGKEEQSKKVSENFYALYENAKKYSGVTKDEELKGTTRNAYGKLKYLIEHYLTNEQDKTYLNLIQKVIELKSIPLIYLKKIATLKIDENVIKELKSIVSEKYIDTLIQKNNDIKTEPETILLAEEF